jgi:hypothetical protein
MFFWDIIIVGAWFAPGPIHCLPYLTSYIKCDFIISFLSLGNLLIENTQEEWKEKLIGRYILSKQHSMRSKKFDKVMKHFNDT